MHNSDLRHDIPRAFISSTVEDLRRYRLAARDAVIRTNLFPEMQEYFTASDDNPPLEECLRRVRTAEVLIVIVARRYGWVPEGQAPNQYKSITWLEAEEAVRTSKEVLAFILDESAEWPKDATEGYRLAVAAERADVTPELASEVQRKIKNLSRFKKWLQARSICAKFKTADSLKANVEAALREWRTRHRDLSDAPVARRDGTRDPRTSRIFTYLSRQSQEPRN